MKKQIIFFLLPTLPAGCPDRFPKTGIGTPG